uniref:Mitochondrial fission 1 protein n=1 Tax=Eurycantha calcarata TaxID=93610 RepID=A0A481SXM6_9NEOP|nr:hypothetical protein [Eurycantha calcarata]
MEDVLDEIIPTDELKKFEHVYHNQLIKGSVTDKAQFEYAWCLVRSKFPTDIKKGIILFEDSFQKGSGDAKRDCLYYLAIGCARLKEYSKALQYVRAFLQVEPDNQQVQTLERQIKKRMEKEGLVGMAMAGAIVLALGGLVGLGVAMRKKS